MHWIAASQKGTATDRLEKRFWDAAGQSRANPSLTPQGYSSPILGLSFYDELHDATAPLRLRPPQVAVQPKGDRTIPGVSSQHSL